MDNVSNILKEFPPVSENNARSIIRSKLLAFKKLPSDMLAQELEQYGITVDWSDADNGTAPRGGK